MDQKCEHPNWSGGRCTLCGIKLPFSLAIGIHIGKRVVSRDQPPTTYHATEAEAHSAFRKFERGFIGGAIYNDRGVEWASIRKDGKEIWRKQRQA